jgi:hypothetical protein
MKASSLLLTAVFFAFLATPGVAWLFGVEGGGASLQNRSTSKPPAWSWKAAWDGSLAREVDAYVWDNVPFRAAFLKLEHSLSSAVFRDSPVPGVIIVGEGGFQFVKERTVGVRGGFIDAKRIDRTLANIERAFDDAGVPFFLVISPTKAIAHAERLPPGVRRVFDTTVQVVSDGLERRAQRDQHLVPLWAAFRAERDRLRTADVADDRLRTLFRAHDLHWNLEAGRLQAKAIVDAVAPGIWDPRCAPVLDGHFVELDPELKNIYTKIGPTEPYQSLVLAPGVALTRQKPPVKQSLAWTTTSPCPTSPRKLSVLRDSFLSSFGDAPAPAQDGGMQAIASFFAASTFVHWDALATDTARAQAALAAGDVVVVQIVQANLGNLVTHEKKLVDLARSMKR